MLIISGQTKNLFVSEGKPIEEKGDAESSTESTSDYDADPPKSQSRPMSLLKSVGRRASKASNPQNAPNKELLSASPISPSSSVPKDTGILVNNRDAATTQPTKVRMSMELASLLVYTVGVKCRGINKKERYAIEHMFSLSEKSANKLLKRQDGAMDLIKHNRNHLVRVYPRGTRLSSTNFEPHRYWASGAQLVAINWQTFGE
jgi:phosphatidylinositol phospholipase C delta